MRAVVMDEFGGPGVLQVREMDDPRPGPLQVLISVAFASVTFVETQVRGGRGPAAMDKPRLPRVPGNGVGGRVIAVGSEVDPAMTGTVVVSTTGGEGGYAELALARAVDTVPVPAGLDVRAAVALLADGRTAVHLHRQAAVKGREWVLVEAAGGGVGSLLVQLGAEAGARVIGAAGGRRKADLVRSLGASAYVDYSRPDWGHEVRELTAGAGVDLVFDGVGGSVGAAALSTLRDGGRASIFGMASGSWTELDGDRANRRSITIIGGAPPTPSESRALTQEALARAAGGRLRPIIGQTFPLADAAAAHRAIEARETTGKTLLIP